MFRARVTLKTVKMREEELPPLAPMTATLLFVALVVENCLAATVNGCWNLENILNKIFISPSNLYRTWDVRLTDRLEWL
jgi:hypothetical protein